MQKALGQDVRASTHLNAIKVALALYLVRVRTGHLPDSLPPGLPKDLFSNQDFEYVKTSPGFVLQCRTQDPYKDEIPKFAFKVK